MDWKTKIKYYKDVFQVNVLLFLVNTIANKGEVTATFFSTYQNRSIDLILSRYKVDVYLHEDSEKLPYNSEVTSSKQALAWLYFKS